MDKPKENRASILFQCNHFIAEPCQFYNKIETSQKHNPEWMCDYCNPMTYICTSKVAKLNRMVMECQKMNVKVEVTGEI